MLTSCAVRSRLTLVLCLGGLCCSSGLLAQDAPQVEAILAEAPSAPPGFAAIPYPESPLRYATGEGFAIEVEVLARGLSLPWGMAFLPDGTLLVTERNKGQLRVIRDGVLDPAPVAGLPEIRTSFFGGLLDVVLHPDFTRNQLVYLTYNKPIGAEESATAILRARWDGQALREAEDIFVTDTGVSGSSRLLFGRDGMLYMSNYGGSDDAQDLAQQRGKVLRLTDSGGVPQDNPFINTPGARPEIYTLGHRTIQGMTLHPETGEIWSAEMGPNGGDEINILKPGANYGWPYVSLGRDYAGPWQAEEFKREGYENPVVYWTPSISVSGLVFYTGDKVPLWQNDLFVGGLRQGEIPGTGQMNRVRFNANGEEIRREAFFGDWHQRLRGAYQGPDGYLYLLIDAEDAAILRIGAAE